MYSAECIGLGVQGWVNRLRVCSFYTLKGPYQSSGHSKSHLSVDEVFSSQHLILLINNKGFVSFHNDARTGAQR